MLGNLPYGHTEKEELAKAPSNEHGLSCEQAGPSTCFRLHFRLVFPPAFGQILTGRIRATKRFPPA